MLGARDQLIALEAAKKATLEQLQQAKREFEVGTKTIIDTNEAQARYDQIVAQEQVALGTLLVRRSELQTIIGRDLGTLAPLRDRPNLTPPKPTEHEGMGARRGGHELRGADRARQLRDRRARSAAAERRLQADGGRRRRLQRQAVQLDTRSMDWITRASYRDRSACSSTCRSTRAGWCRAACARRCRCRTASTPSSSWPAATSANAARDAYTGVNYGLAQVRALESAEVSARTQLESTQLGYQVGVRILLDVLNATTQLVQTQRDLKRARYDFLLAALRLKASSGSLTDEDVAGVNGLLDPAVPLTVPDVTPEGTSLMEPPARKAATGSNAARAAASKTSNGAPAVKAKSSPSKRPS